MKSKPTAWGQVLHLGIAQTQDLTPRRSPPISNGRMGMMLLVGSLTVLFTCFISAYIVLRKAEPMWPPAGTPLLDTGLSGFNTAVLVISAGVAWMARSKKLFI